MESLARRRRIIIDDDSSSSGEDSVEILKSSNNDDLGNRKISQTVLDDDDDDGFDSDEDESMCKASKISMQQNQNISKARLRPIILEDSSDSESDNEEVDLIDSDTQSEVDLVDSNSDSDSDSDSDRDDEKEDYFNTASSRASHEVPRRTKKISEKTPENNNFDSASSPDSLEQMMSSLQVSGTAKRGDLSNGRNSTSSSSSSSSSLYLTPSSSSRRESTIHDQQNSYTSSSESDSLQTPTQSGSKFSISSKSEDSKSSSVAASYDDEYDNCAWSFSKRKKSYYLSAKKFSIKGVTWPKLSLSADLYGQLYSHQKEGVQWMASLHSNGIGGILGDDMGLGKTYQTLTFLGGLMRSKTIRNALIIAPVSVLRSWEKEANQIMKGQCVPKVTILVASSDVPKRQRYNMLLDAQECSSKNPHLVMTTYGLVRSAALDFVAMEKQLDRPCWDYVVCDEGHLIKNPSAQTSKACHRVCKNQSTHRLLLTGTPIQNNLKEMWALFDWATSGRLLGKPKVFENRFAIPIEEGRNKYATNWSMNVAEKRGNELQALIRPHFLQRLKKTTFGDKLPTKRELVVFTHLSSKQRQMYEAYIEGEKVVSVLRGEVASPLESITWLKKLCGHPLLAQRQGQDLGVSSIIARKLIRRSAKLEVLVALIEKLRNSHHRTLIFSQSTRMLDIIERALSHVRTSRIDGSTKQKDRQKLVDEFNNNGNVDAMLLSTKAAGLGLTLTGADRCIVYDPSWNPAEDSQAVDRCYRIGQMKNVTVYRLIAAGTVEEKMYEKQVHKDGIRRAIMTTTGTATERFFDKKELKKLFQLAPAGECEILEKIKKNEADGEDRKKSFIESHHGVVGMASHDDIYSRSVIEIEGDKNAQTPFSTPAKHLGRAQSVLSKKMLNFDNEDIVEVSEPYKKAERKEFSEKKISDNEDVVEVSEPYKRAERKEPKTPQTNDQTLEKVFELTESPISCEDRVPPSLDMAKQLEHQGDMCSAMNVLLDLLEKNKIAGSDKLKLHKHIATLARKLERLDTVSWF